MPDDEPLDTITGEFNASLIPPVQTLLNTLTPAQKQRLSMGFTENSGVLLTSITGDSTWTVRMETDQPHTVSRSSDTSPAHEVFRTNRIDELCEFMNIIL